MINQPFDTKHSIYFNNYNTLTDFHLFPEERPFVVPPKPKTDFVEVTGMKGVLDYTNVLVDGPIYEDRNDSWKFKFLYFGNYTWIDLYKDLQTKIHGKWFKKIMLEDDPYHFYRGRIWVESWSEGSDGIEITINYNLDPIKYDISQDPDSLDKIIKKSSIYEDWEWNDLLSINEIYYGKFTVYDKKARTLINNLKRSVSVDIYSSGPMDIKIENETYKIRFGPNSDVFSIKPGRTEANFIGKGTVQLNYLLE